MDTWMDGWMDRSGEIKWEKGEVELSQETYSALLRSFEQKKGMDEQTDRQAGSPSMHSPAQPSPASPAQPSPARLPRRVAWRRVAGMSWSGGGEGKRKTLIIRAKRTPPLIIRAKRTPPRPCVPAGLCGSHITQVG
jgi:hypothetical protein